VRKETSFAQARIVRYQLSPRYITAILSCWNIVYLGLQKNDIQFVCIAVEANKWTRWSLSYRHTLPPIIHSAS
jgi:hypothetical protein